MPEPRVITTSTWLEKLRGFGFAFSMVLSAFFGCVYVLLPLSPLLVVYPRLWRRIVDRLFGFWLVMPSGLMEYLFGVQLSVTGDKIEHSEPALMICNHRTRLDWLFFWNALFRMDPWLLTSEKISLKAILKYVFGAGWAMAANVYIFLDRTFDLDQKRLDKLLDYYVKSGNSYQILLYPEGTDKCPRATGRSKAYAEKTGLTHYDHVLHPRTKGFIYILNKMKRANYIDVIYDVTVGYSDAILQSEIDLVVLGACPKRVHFDVRKILLKDLPSDEVELDKWLRKLWVEKEARLKMFYEKPSETRELDTLPSAKRFELTTYTTTFQLLMIIIWSLLTIVWVYSFFHFSYQYWLVLATFVLFCGSQYFYGGLEFIQAKFAGHEKRKKN